MSHTPATPSHKAVSIRNWIGTLLLYAIPGVNVLSGILFLIFAKNPSKRNFAAASLILLLGSALLFALAFFFFGDTLVSWANRLPRS